MVNGWSEWKQARQRLDNQSTSGRSALPTLSCSPAPKHALNSVLVSLSKDWNIVEEADDDPGGGAMVMLRTAGRFSLQSSNGEAVHGGSMQQVKTCTMQA